MCCQFDDRYNCYEHYQKIYPKLTGSMVPFSLRLAKAALPFLTEKDRSLDQMFELIDWINQRHAESLARSNNVNSGPPEIDPHSRLGSTTEIDDAARAAMDAGQPISDSQTPREPLPALIRFFVVSLAHPHFTRSSSMASTIATNKTLVCNIVES